MNRKKKNAVILSLLFASVTGIAVGVTTLVVMGQHHTWWGDTDKALIATPIVVFSFAGALISFIWSMASTEL